MAELLATFLDNLYNTSYIEGIAALLGILSVWYARKENILVFPVGIVSVLLYVYICFWGKLYADMGVNLFYFIMSAYGWYNWTHGKGEVIEREISRTNTNEKVMVSISFLVCFLGLYYILTNYTDSDVAIVDSLTTSLFIIAMVLMALKKVEHWSFWIVGDIISIHLYIHKGYVLSSFQFIVFLTIAILGLIEWRKRIKVYA